MSQTNSVSKSPSNSPEPYETFGDDSESYDYDDSHSESELGESEENGSQPFPPSDSLIDEEQKQKEKQEKLEKLKRRILEDVQSMTLMDFKEVFPNIMTTSKKAPQPKLDPNILFYEVEEIAGCVTHDIVWDAMRTKFNNDRAGSDSSLLDPDTVLDAEKLPSAIKLVEVHDIIENTNKNGTFSFKIEFHVPTTLRKNKSFMSYFHDFVSMIYEQQGCFFKLKIDQNSAMDMKETISCFFMLCPSIVWAQALDAYGNRFQTRFKSVVGNTLVVPGLGPDGIELRLVQIFHTGTEIPSGHFDATSVDIKGDLFLSETYARNTKSIYIPD